MSFWDDDDKSVEEEKGIVNKQNPFANQKDKKYKYNDSESSEDNKRVLKTPKEKLTETIKTCTNKIKDNIYQKNFVSADEAINELVKQSEKIKQIFGENPPMILIKSLFLVEETTNMNKEDRVKLSSRNSTSLIGMKKAFNKIVKNFEENLKAYKDKRAADGESEDELSDLSDDDEVLSDISDVEMKKNDDMDPATRRLKWVKKTPTVKTDDPVKPRTDRIRPAGQSKLRERDETVQQEKLDDKIIDKECNDIMNQRGQVSKNPSQTVERLDYLVTQTNNKLLKIKLLNSYILICFDTSIGQFNAISYEMWHKIYESVLILIDYFNELIENNEEKQKEELENIRNNMNNTLISVLEKLEIELYKSLQYTDQNSKEYILRIKDEITLITLCDKILGYYKTNIDKSYKPRIYILILLHIFYKNEEQLKRIGEKLIQEEINDEHLKILSKNPEKFMDEISILLYSNPEEKSKIKAIFLLIQSFCLMNKYQKANNFFKKCNYYDLISNLKDENLKILHNRAMVQLGLCAFRNGNFQDALLYLMPLCQMGVSKLKEYLSQHYNKEMEKSIFFDKEDKKRIVPFIMTINIEEVECTFYLASLLLDLPNILLYKLGKNSGNSGKVNLVFKKLMDNFEKQIFNGPPETIKELILYSASSLTKGDWKKCSDLILTLKCFNHYKNCKEIKSMISTKIKSTSLKCYLIFYGNEIKNISLNSLCRKFNMEEKEIRILINTLIVDKQMEAKWKEGILEIYSEDRNLNTVKKLEENLAVISQQNLNLLEVSAGINNRK